MTPSWTVSAWDESDLVPEPETTGMQWVWGRREPNFPVRFSCSFGSGCSLAAAGQQVFLPS